MTRSTSDLAADVRSYLMKQTCSQEHHDALAALSELVALVGTLAEDRPREDWLQAHADRCGYCNGVGWVTGIGPHEAEPIQIDCEMCSGTGLGQPIPADSQELARLRDAVTGPVSGAPEEGTA